MSYPSPCSGCGIDTTPSPIRNNWEWYMVHRHIWIEAGMGDPDDGPHGGRGFLCVGCLEDRLGRRVGPADFTSAPVNEPTMFTKTERLINRLTGGV